MNPALVSLASILAVLLPGGLLYRVNKRAVRAQAGLDEAKASATVTGAAGEAVTIMRALLDEVVEAADRRAVESDRRIGVAERKADAAIERANLCEERERMLREEVRALTARLAAVESRLD